MAKKTAKTANQGLLGLEVRNFRALADISLELGPLNVFFGPNGAGKSSLLDSLWFLHDCATRGVGEASALRNQGIGLLWYGAADGAKIAIKLKTAKADYEVTFSYVAGRPDSSPGELLRSWPINDALVREAGSNKAKFIPDEPQFYREASIASGALALTYAGSEMSAAREIHKFLSQMQSYFSLAVDVRQIRNRGSQSTPDFVPTEDGANVLSVLRNLYARQSLDERYDTIIGFMREAFPAFQNIIIEQTGVQWVYGSFIEKDLRQPIPVANISDGYLQMLLHLTALFCKEKNDGGLIMFDEPENSLHPHAIAIFAKAVKLAIKEWHKQIFIATHSPVLLSQFKAENVFAVGKKESATFLRRVSELSEIDDLLEDYALGSLYMAELVAPQSVMAGTEN